MKFYIFLGMVSLLSAALVAQSPLKDPQIPSGETLKYKVTEGDKTYFLDQEVAYLALGSEAGYLLTSSGPEGKTFLKVLARGMEPRNTMATSLLNGAILTSELTLDGPLPQEKNEFYILKTADLGFLLRGYPFSSPRTLGVTIVGSPKDSGFRWEVQYRGVEDLRTGQGAVKSHKLELVSVLSGPLVLFGSLIPKIYFWYETKSPYRLLRYEGTAGPGTKPQVMLLQ